MKPITLEELETATPAQCNKAGCTEVHDHLDASTVIGFWPACHVGSTLVAVYLKGSGLVHLVCATCRNPFAAIAVAAQAPGGKGLVH